MDDDKDIELLIKQNSIMINSIYQDSYFDIR